MPTHFGTHTDAYSHFRGAGGTIDRMDIVLYVGAASFSTARRSGPSQLLGIHTACDTFERRPGRGRKEKAHESAGWK